MTRKRGYSKAFPTGGATRRRFDVDRVPARLFRRVKAKSKRSGISIRAKLLSVLTAWVEEPDLP